MNNGSGIFKSFAIAVVIVLAGFLLLFEEIHFGWIIARNPIFKPLFRELATSGNSRISTYSIDSLISMLSPNDFDFWLKVLENPSSDDYLKGHALLALRAINNPKAIDAITNVFENTNKLNAGSSNSSWVWAFTALAKMKGEAFCPEILKIWGDSSYALKEEALGIINYCPAKIAIQNIDPLFKSPESITLTFKNGNTKDNTADEIHDLQGKALSSLSNSNSPEVIAYLIDLSNSENMAFVEMSIAQLSKIVRTSPQFKEVLKGVFITKLNPNYPDNIRLASLNTLYNVYGSESYNIFKQYENDPSIGKAVKQGLEIMERNKNLKENY